MKNEWIECNLPIRLSYEENEKLREEVEKKAKEKIPRPDISDDIKKHFDPDAVERIMQLKLSGVEKRFDDIIYDEVNEKKFLKSTKSKHKSMLEFDNYAEMNKRFIDWLCKTIYKDDDEFCEYCQLLDIAKDIDRFIGGHPKIEQYNIDLFDAEAEEYKRNPKCFMHLGVMKPGILLDVDDGDNSKIVLVGHVNKLFGVCDDCVEFSGKAIVKRYKTVWEENDE